MPTMLPLTKKQTTVLLFVLAFALCTLAAGTYAWVTIMQNLTNEFTFEPFAVRLIKVSAQDESKRLQGAEFELYDELDPDNPIGTFRTDHNGEIVVGTLDPGKQYYFKEVGAPYGYRFDALDCQTPTFAANELTELVVKNDELTAALSIYKTVADTYYPAPGDTAPKPYTPTPEDLLLPFAFTVSLEDRGVYPYIIYDSGNKPIVGYTYNSPLDGPMSEAGAGQISDGGTIWLRHGEHAVIGGLRVGSSYTVREKSYFEYDGPLQLPSDNDFDCTDPTTPHDKEIATASGWAMQGHNTTGEVRLRETLPDGTVVEGSSAVFENRRVRENHKVTISSLVVVDRILAHPDDVDYNKDFQVTVDIGDNPNASFYYELVHLEATENTLGGGYPFHDYYERNDPGVPKRLAPQPDRVPEVEDFFDYTLTPIGISGVPGDKTPSSDRWTLPKIPESYAANIPLHLPDDTERWERQDGSYGELLMSADPTHNPKSDRSNKIVVDLHHGSAVIVYGIPTGTAYSVEQVNYREIDGYILDSAHKSTGTILPDLDVLQDPDTEDPLLRRVRVDIYNAFVYPLTRTLTVEKKWEHGSNANPPASTVIEVYDTVTGQLFDSRNYKSTGETVQIGNLPIFQPGTRIPIVYSVREQLPEDYILDTEQTPDGFVLTNTYAPATVQPGIYKRVTGTPPRDEIFTFTIDADDSTPAAPLPTPATAAVTGQGVASFAPIKFSPTGSNGEIIYKYKITEQQPVNTADYDYDQTVYIMRVHLLEKDNKLTVTTTYTRQSDGKEIRLPLPFVNVYKVVPPASLVITKRVVGAPANTRWAFKFHVWVDGVIDEVIELSNASPSSATKVYTNLPQGAKYEVTELSYAGYTPSYDNTEGKLTGQVTEAKIINRWGVDPGLGQLEVTKRVAGAGGDTNKEFRFTLQVDGKEHKDSPFYLKHGEKRTFGPFVTNTSYSVQEHDYSGEGYTTNKEGSVGVIVPQGSAAVFTNTCAEVPMGSLSITKRLLGDAADTTKRFEFTVTIGGKQQRISLAANEIYTFTGIPAGTSYSVTEDNYTSEGYVTEWQGSTGTLHSGSNTAVCTNTKGDVPDPLDKGDLTVTKTVTGAFVDLIQKFNFTVTIGSEVHSFSLRHGESKSFTGIPAGTSYSVVEENYASRGYTTTGNGAGGTISKGGNKAEFTNEYTSKVPPAPDSDAVQIAGTKTWVHGSNPQASHPQVIKVFVMNGSTIVAQKSVSAQDEWRYAFNLPKYDAQGSEIRYSINEENVPHYVKSISGYNITNTFTTGGPDTGDSNQMNIWIILLALSTAGLYTAVFHQKKERDKK